MCIRMASEQNFLPIVVVWPTERNEQLIITAAS